MVRSKKNIACTRLRFRPGTTFHFLIFVEKNSPHAKYSHVTDPPTQTSLPKHGRSTEQAEGTAASLLCGGGKSTFMKLKRFLLRYYPPGIILEYEQQAEVCSQKIAI